MMSTGGCQKGDRWTRARNAWSTRPAHDITNCVFMQSRRLSHPYCFVDLHNCPSNTVASIEVEMRTNRYPSSAADRLGLHTTQPTLGQACACSEVRQSFLAGEGRIDILVIGHGL